jgi:hypothetical protein
MAMTDITSIQIPKEIDSGFEVLAKETQLPKNVHLERALKNYLKQHERKGSKAMRPQSEAPSDLDKIDVVVQTKHIHEARLNKARAELKRKVRLESPFFSSSPVDLGYTDAQSHDEIIAGDG